jgi:hypothetical protein
MNISVLHFASGLSKQTLFFSPIFNIHCSALMIEYNRIEWNRTDAGPAAPKHPMHIDQS